MIVGIEHGACNVQDCCCWEKRTSHRESWVREKVGDRGKSTSKALLIHRLTPCCCLCWSLCRTCISLNSSFPSLSTIQPFHSNSISSYCLNPLNLRVFARGHFMYMYYTRKRCQLKDKQWDACSLFGNTHNNSSSGSRRLVIWAESQNYLKRWELIFRSMLRKQIIANSVGKYE